MAWTARTTLSARNPAHRHHHRSVERPGRNRRDLRDEHRDVPARPEVRQRDAVADQRVLEGEAASEQERHQIVAPPVRRSVRGSSTSAPGPIDAVPRHVGPDVRAGGAQPRLDLSRPRAPRSRGTAWGCAGRRRGSRRPRRAEEWRRWSARSPALRRRWAREPPGADRGPAARRRSAEAGSALIVRLRRPASLRHLRQFLADPPVAPRG